MTPNRGARFESLARDYLQDHGLQTLASNYRCRGGELDLVMQDARHVVFVEVRYRRSARFGSAAESVDPLKQKRIVAAATHFLHSHPAMGARPCRFDVVALSGPDDRPEIEWIRDAFRP